LGVDFGEKRVGLALSDESRTLASPLGTIRRRAGKRPPIARIADVAREHAAVHVVFGLPLELDGSESAWCAEIRRIGAVLADRLGVPVHYVDERMTSVRAERAIRSIGLPRGKREEKARVDAAAAALILQGWLDREEIAR
jgi:putative holliday junction resolvase